MLVRWPVRCSLLAFLLVVSAASGADLTVLKGDVIKGEVVGLTDKDVVLTQDGKRVTRPLADVLKIDFREPGKIAAGTAYAQVELTDGTLLNCSKWLVKRKEVELTLLAGPVLKVPLTSVSNVLTKAQVEANRSDWKTRVVSKRGHDVLVLLSKGRPANLPCTFDEGDATGESIRFAVDLDGTVETQSRKLDTVHGLIFKHTLPPGAPPVSCRLLDGTQDVVMVSGVALKDGTFTVTTPVGARLEYKADAVARLDYSKGKLDYLSEMDWLSMKASSVHDDEGNGQRHVYRDTNLGSPDPAPITLGGVTFNRGLTLRPEVELVYDLKGNYNEFSAVVGLDDRVPTAEGAVELTIEGDGRELKSFTFSDKDERKFQPVKLNLKNVLKLRLVVRSKGKTDGMKHVALGDAKVSQ
jgi:hypothetical protein